MKLVAIAAFAALLAVPAAAQENTEAIVKGLLPASHSRTRSLTPPPCPTRAIIVDKAEPKKTLESIKDQPSVNIRVLFEYDSAKLTEDGKKTLETLGKALQDPRLCNAPVLIAGHTDARGSDAYNKKLSEDRADAVREHLARNFSIAPERLTAIGFGEQKLADPARPEDGVNRRVEVVNLSR